MSIGYPEATTATATAPRVNKKYMSNYINQTVTLIGKVLEYNPDAAILKTSDNKNVTVIPLPTSDYGANFVEIIGKVNEDFSIQEYKCTQFGDNFDLETYDQFITLAHTQFQSQFL